MDAPPASSPQGEPKAPRGAWDPLRSELVGLPVPAVVACVVSMVVLTVSHYQGGTGYYRAHLSRYTAVGASDVDAYLYWFVTSIGLYVIVPVLACALTPGIRIRETGLGLGDWRFGLLASGLLVSVFLPVVSLAARTEEFQGHYPLCRGVRETPWVFVLYEATYVLYFFAWEYLFRGYLLFSLSPSIGKLAAVVQMMPFTVAHLGKPELESLGAIVAGVVLGLVALRARSALYGGLIHATIAVSMDLFAD